MPLAAAEILVSDRLTLTPLSVADADEMHAVLAEPVLYRFTGGAPPSLDGLRRRFTAQCADSPEAGVSWRNWISRLPEDGVAVGLVQATVTDDLADIAWLTGVPWQGRGIASEGAAMMCTWLAAHGIRRLAAHIHPEHRASARVARGLGLAPTTELDADGERIWTSTS